MTLTINPQHAIGRGDQLWLVSGRIPGSDDDTAQLVLADSADDARDTFTDWMINSSNIDQETEDDLRAAHGSACFIIKCEQLGEDDPDEGLEIQRTLMVSTAHLPDLHRDWLQAQNRCNPAFPDIFLPTEINPEACEVGPYLIVDPISEYGWRVCLTPDSTKQFLGNHFLTDPLVGLILFAQEHHCDWLGIDRDGPVIDGLPTFED